MCDIEEDSKGSLNKADFEHLFREQYQPLCAYVCFKYGFDSATAEDIVSSGFAKLWEVKNALSKDSTFKSYIYKIIDNSSLNTIKHNKYVQAYQYENAKNILLTHLGDGFENIDFNELRRCIDQAINELPVQMRRIFELSRYEGLKYKEIATQLNISVKTVETQMGRALNKLRKHLAVFYPCYIVTIIINCLFQK